MKIGASSITGDLKHYDIVFKGKTMEAAVTLDGTIPAWRSQTGSIFFGDNEEHYFAWLPAIPEGKAAADVKYYGKEVHLEGSATIEKLEGGAVVETVTEPSAVWELMYFGKAGADKAWRDKNK